MKIRNLMATALVLAIASCGSIAVAVPIYFVNDDFESYTSQADFNAAWANSAGTQPTWSTDQSTSPIHSILEPAGSPGRVTHVASADPTNSINGTATQPLLLSFNIYINPDDLTSSRRYMELRTEAGDATNLFALGLSNISGLDNTKFGFRNHLAWTGLAADRLPGWNSVAALIDDTQIHITINNNPTETFARNNTGGYGRLYMGSNFSNNTVAPFAGFTYLDDVVLAIIPEPSSLLLSALGMLGVAGFRRRKA